MVSIFDRLAAPQQAVRGLGFPVGPSSGLNVFAAARVAADVGPPGVVVTVLPDRMERYFSTELFGPFRDADAHPPAGK